MSVLLGWLAALSTLNYPYPREDNDGVICTLSDNGQQADDDDGVLCSFSDDGPQADDGGILRERQNMLLEENARLRNMRTCQRCHDRPVGVIFLPCGHIIACTTCAPNIRRCLRCDTVIRATANVFFS